MSRYEKELADAKAGFEYEDCHECGGGVDDHTWAPDMFGLPHAWCKR